MRRQLPLTEGHPEKIKGGCPKIFSEIVVYSNNVYPLAGTL
jgi:hypothetical protein